MSFKGLWDGQQKEGKDKEFLHSSKSFSILTFSLSFFIILHFIVSGLKLHFNNISPVFWERLDTNVLSSCCCLIQVQLDVSDTTGCVISRMCQREQHVSISWYEKRWTANKGVHVDHFHCEPTGSSLLLRGSPFSSQSIKALDSEWDPKRTVSSRLLRCSHPVSST